MSFVQHLRMRNMFPINSNLGSAKINLSGPDPMHEVINLINMQREQNVPRSGLQQVAGMSRNQNSAMEPMHEPLKFGGVIGPVSNPGADILARSKESAEQTYAGYPTQFSQPIPKGPSNDEQFLADYFDRKNKETVANATAANAGNRGWKTVNITDPSDPTKTTAIQVNDQTGETRDINLPGQITNREKPADIQKRIDTDIKSESNRKSFLDKANDSLSVIGDLMGPDGKLTKEGTSATGWTSLLNWIPTTKAYSGGLKIEKLRNEQVLTLIKELKEQSRTGATGMGNMSNKDLSVINKAASLLDAGLDEEEFRKQLGTVKTELEDIVNRLMATAPTGMKPAVSHSTGDGRIRVRNKQTGQTGTISAGAFNAQKYDRVQ